MTTASAELARETSPVRPRSSAAATPAATLTPAGCAFTGLTKVLPGHEDTLAAYLTQLGTDIKGATDISFSRLRAVHFFRWVIVHDTAGDPWLAFESNFDGSIENHFGELVQVGAAGIHAIYRHCVGYPCEEQSALSAGDETAVVAFLQKQSIGHAAFHVALHGKSAERIRRESEIRDTVERFIDDRRASGAWEKVTPDAMYDQIVDHLSTVGLLADAQQTQPPPPVSRIQPWLLRALPVAILLLPLALPLYIWLRIRESIDTQDDVTVEPPGIRELAEREDFQVQNQLTHVVDVKPGFLRRWMLRGVLWVIDLMARYQFNQGHLGSITTIHFARWSFIDNQRRLLFFSNYDGSWENYLGDFIDKASTGLTGVWSNTKGFPRTKNLVQQGSTDEERFKSWTRAHQIPTQLWYSAYPELTVFNIQQNAKICSGLAARPATPEAMRAWLECL